MAGIQQAKTWERIVGLVEHGIGEVSLAYGHIETEVLMRLRSSNGDSAYK